MVKKCDKELNKLNEYLDKKLDLEKKGLSYIDVELERHVANCSSCREEMEDQQDLFDALAGIDQIEPPADFTDQLMARLPRTSDKSIPRWGLALGALMFSASSVVLFAVIYWLFRSGQTIGYFKNISKTAFVNTWEFLKYIVTFLLDATEFVLGMIKAVWAIVKAYPLSFVTMALIGVLLFVVLIRMINNFQSENFA